MQVMQFIKTFDISGIRLAQALPAGLQPIMVFATFVGYPAVTVILGSLLAGAAWLAGRQRISYALAASMASFAGAALLKLAIHRPRPDTMYVKNMFVKSYSFPSGHAFDAAVFYGLLAYLAFKYLPSPWSYIIAVVLVLLILLIGTSRVYLGAHYPTDVLAGWLLGLAVLILIVRAIHP